MNLKNQTGAWRLKRAFRRLKLLGGLVSSERAIEKLFRFGFRGGRTSWICQ